MKNYYSSSHSLPLCVFQAQHHPPITVQPLCHWMQLGPPVRVRRRLHLRPPPRCFQVRQVASVWTWSPASSLFLISQSFWVFRAPRHHFSYKPVNRIHFYFNRKRLCYVSEQPDVQPRQLTSTICVIDNKNMLNLTFVVLFQWSNCSRALWERDSPRGGVSVRLRPAALLQWRCLQPDRLQHFLQVREARHHGGFLL